MKAQWLGSLKGDERENFRLSVQSSKLVLDKLNEIVYNMYKEAESTNSIDYDSPSWSHKQAHYNGMREAYSKILELTNLDAREPSLKQ